MSFYQIILEGIPNHASAVVDIDLEVVQTTASFGKRHPAIPSRSARARRAHLTGSLADLVI
jgi:hypothetical protein